jgi:hypothetical protein
LHVALSTLFTYLHLPLTTFQAGLTSRDTTATEAEASDGSNSTDEPPAKPPITRIKLLSQDTLNHTLVRNSFTASALGNQNAAATVLARYLNEAADDSDILSPLDFWLDRLTTYPMIAPLALDLVTCQASQASVE